MKEYYSRLTDIVRVYIEGRFDVTAMEMTTDEILDARDIDALEQEVKKELRDILMRADLVKFAKFLPTPEEHEASLRLAVKFVEMTWRQPAPAVEENVVEQVAA